MGRRKERSKTGCTSCLRRKIKCDEQHPTCRRCVDAKIECSWDVSSRITVQKARIRCKAIAYSTKSPKFGRPNAGDKAVGNIRDAPTSKEDDAALSFTTHHDIQKSPDGVHTWYIDHHCLNRDSTLAIPNLLCSSSIYPPSIPCANSILLSPRDRLYLEYFPASSLVKVLGKAYTWSNFRYLCQQKASDEAMVMYGILALSAGELNKSSGQANSHDESLFYYCLALQRIVDALGNLTFDSNGMEALLSALFLVITYEWRFGSSKPHLKSPNQVLFTFLDVFLQSDELGSNGSINLTTCPSFTPFCAQILLWILYIESSCLFENLSFELMDHFYISRGESQLQDLFSVARHSYGFIYGQQYPVDQQQDDLENYSPLELIHQDYLLRYRILRLAERYRRGERIQSELEVLWREISAIRKVYHDLFRVQKSPKEFRHRRAFITLCEGLAGYYCSVLLVCRLFPCLVVPMQSRDQALSELFDVCYTIHEWYPLDPALGFPWFLLIAGLETKDRIHRQWVYDRLKNLGETWNTCKWARDILRLAHDPESKVGRQKNIELFLRCIQPIS